MEVLKEDYGIGEPEEPLMVETVLGWVLSGP